MSKAPEAARIAAPFRAGPKQLALAELWYDPAVRVMAGGAIRSGKSQGAARLFVETAVQMPATYLVARASYRELEDSTKKALLHGDGDMPPAIPPELVESYRASDNVVRLRTGSEILFRSFEEGNVSKLLNLTLGAVLVDQAEELDGGDVGERVIDTLVGRLSDPRGPRKLLLVCNPSGLTHFLYRRFVGEETRDRDAGYVHFTLHDNAANLPPDFVVSMEGRRESRPSWYATYVEGRWGSFEGMAFPEFSETIHLVEPFPLPHHFEQRFESLDHGQNHPTHGLWWAADSDGNLLIFDEYAKPGLVSKHAAEIQARREKWGTRTCWADPSVFASQGLSTKRGLPASVATEYGDHGVFLARANNDRVAGYTRLTELLHVEPGRIPPPWASIREGIDGAPRLYIASTCRELIRQIKSAPIAVDGLEIAEAVDRHWEGEHGHGVAAARYGALSRPAPSRPLPPPEPDDWRAWRQAELLREHDERIDSESRGYASDRYDW